MCEPVFGNKPDDSEEIHADKDSGDIMNDVTGVGAAGAPHVEAQRKFLLKDETILTGKTGISIKQGYLHTREGLEIKVRLKDDEAFLTVKGDGPKNQRLRYTNPIPVSHAESMLDCFCADTLVEKTRYQITHNGITWEIDAFHGRNSGLIVAEIDLENPEQEVEFPEWIGTEVTDDTRYSNASLCSHPYNSW